MQTAISYASNYQLCKNRYTDNYSKAISITDFLYAFNNLTVRQLNSSIDFSNSAIATLQILHQNTILRGGQEVGNQHQLRIRIALGGTLPEGLMGNDNLHIRRD